MATLGLGVVQLQRLNYIWIRLMMADSYNKIKYLNDFIDKHIDAAAKNTEFNLDFLEGYVYALLLVKQEIRGLNLGSEKEDGEG
jgi:hypothetical protein